MATSTTIPVTFDPEAGALVAALGLEGPFREMIEHGKRAVPNLRRIEVEYGHKVEEPDDPTIVLTLIVDPPADRGILDDPIRNDLVGWFLRTYPGEVARHFLFDVLADLS